MGRHALRADLHGTVDPIARLASRSTLFGELDVFMAGERSDGSPRATGFDGKGFLATMVKVTTHAARASFPLTDRDFITSGGGQVISAPVAEIMARHGVDRRLSSEVGRTSRGTILYARDYAEFLSDLVARRGPVDLSIVRHYWVRAIRDLLNREPLELKWAPGDSFEMLAGGVIGAARLREKSLGGFAVAGAVMQHMVAVICAARGCTVANHKAFQSDSQTGRGGDFDFPGAVWHVTTAPTEDLVRKCVDNLAQGLRPVIVTLASRAPAARALAENRGVDGQIEVIAFEALVAQHIVLEVARSVAPGGSGRSATACPAIGRTDGDATAASIDPDATDAACDDAGEYAGVGAGDGVAAAAVTEDALQAGGSSQDGAVPNVVACVVALLAAYNDRVVEIEQDRSLRLVWG